MSAETNPSSFVDVSATGAKADGAVVEQPRDSFAVASVHETAVKDIVGMVRAKYEDEGDRNFAIGQRAYEHAQWQRGNFAGYGTDDFDNLMNDVRDKVRIHVAISPKSIKLGEWVRCYVLRMLVAAAKGDDIAHKLSFFEYRTVYGKALTFSKGDVEGSIVDGWLDFIVEIATIRTTQLVKDGAPVFAVDGSPVFGRVSSEDFADRMAKHEKRLADAKAPKLTPEQATVLKSVEDAKAKTAATSKATKTLTETVSDALAERLMPVEAVLGIVENVAKHHGVELPKLGTDPATVRVIECDLSKLTIAECDRIADQLFKDGRFNEMIHLRNKLDKLVSAADKARVAHNTHVRGTAKAQLAEVA